MRPWRTLLAGALATLWVAIGAHCRLEALPGFEFLACEQQSAAEHSPAHSERDCGDGACWAIESGSYQAEKPLTAPAKPAPMCVARLPLLSDLAQAQVPDVLSSISPAPPELPGTWQFSHRAALPPRAPSFDA
jgi:hypothetical protein